MVHRLLHTTVMVFYDSIKSLAPFFIVTQWCNKCVADKKFKSMATNLFLRRLEASLSDLSAEETELDCTKIPFFILYLKSRGSWF